MKVWKDLLVTALIGTERQGFTPPPAPGALGEALARIDAESVEGQLLGAAALVATWCKAGRVLPSGAVAPETANEEERCGCPEAAGHRLARLVAGGESFRKDVESRLLQEWLALAKKERCLVPPECLPDLLERARSDAALFERMVSAHEELLGRRGIWLAGMNSDWRFVMGGGPEDAVDAWETGTVAERKARFRELRRKEPRTAFALLEQAWSRESAAERQAFLELLHENLDASEEPFLEAALDDRSKIVRQTAAVLLSCLPGSAFARRMTKRAAGLVRVKKGLLGNVSLKVDFPDTLTDDMKRDGIEEQKYTDKAVGAKGSLLQQIIHSTPLEHWTRDNGLTPDELFGAARKSDWSDVLMGGWVVAAVNQRNADWMSDFLTSRHSPLARLPVYRMENLLAALNEEKWRTALRTLIDRMREPEEVRVVAELLQRRGSVMDASLVEALAARSDQPACGVNRKTSFWWSSILEQMALWGDPVCYPSGKLLALRLLDEPSTQEPVAVHEALALYEYRHQMHEEFRP